MAFSQLVTLFLTPVFYTYFDELPEGMRGLTRKTVARIRGRRRPSLAPNEAVREYLTQGRKAHRRQAQDH